MSKEVWNANSLISYLYLVKCPRLSAAIVGYHTKVFTFRGQRKLLFLLIDLCNLLGNHQSLKALYIINSENV